MKKALLIVLFLVAAGYIDHEALSRVEMSLKNASVETPSPFHHKNPLLQNVENSIHTSLSLSDINITAVLPK